VTERSLRLDRLGRRLHEVELDGLLITHPPNLYYLFGFTGSFGVALWLDGEAILIVDSRYLEQAREETSHCRVQLSPNPFGSDLQSLLSPSKRIGIEAERMSHSFALTIASWFDNWEPVPTYGLVEEIRALKSDAETEKIRAACRLANRAFTEFAEGLDWASSETAAAASLEFICRTRGSSGAPFDTIVASGPRSALPHGVAGSRTISRREVLLVDFGARLDAYCSDLTRVILPVNGRVREVHAIVREAQEATIAAVRPGVSVVAADAAARKVITSAGYGEYFGHGTGHGLGLEVHELPRISPRGEGVLVPGMVFTVEPGIYLPGEFGIRLEEVVSVTATGCEVLSRD
jgi:Xaa-Pro aminopeptidase